MTKSLIRIAMMLVIGACLVSSLFAQAQSAPPLNSKVETVLTLAAPGNTENIAQGPDGALYITGIMDRILWKVTPDGKAENFFASPSHAAFVGVAASKDEIILGVFQRPYLRPPAGGGAPRMDMTDVGSQILILDKAGKVKGTVEGQAGQFFNGIARVRDGVYLITDTNGKTLLRLDTANKKIEPWLTDDQLTGQNGIKIQNGWVYIASGDPRVLYRIQIDSNGKPTGGLKLFVQGARPDDFAIAPDGTLYVPVGMTMMKVSPSGEVSTFLENVPNGAGAWVTPDGKWLYWPTRAGPAKLLRVALK